MVEVVVGDGVRDVDPDEAFVETRSRRQQWLELVLLSLCNIAWNIDSSLLPMFFTEFQVLFHVSQTELGLLSTVKGWSAALFAFPCGFVGELLPRPRLVGCGMLFWAAGLALCAGATRFEMLFCGRVLNGMGLGLVQPLLLSMVADKSPPSRRGGAFGSLFFTGSVCNTLFGLVATRFAADDVGALSGWRVSIMLVMILSASVGLGIMAFVQEPNAAVLAERRRTQGLVQTFVSNMPKVLQLFKYPTFVLILAQGAPGTAAWTVFPFFTQWLELGCFTHGQAALIFASFGWGCAVANLLSGALLNLVAKRCPDHGPPAIASFSVAMSMPFYLLFFFLLPKPEAMGAGGGAVLPFATSFFLFGLCGMCGTLNKKVFSDIVPAHIFTYVFAVDQLVENLIGNCSALAMGLVTDRVFHSHSSDLREGECAPGEARKLGMGMFVVCCIAGSLCFAGYLAMHCTYPKDRRRQVAACRAQAGAGKAELAMSEKSTSDSMDGNTVTEQPLHR